jgi:glycerol uptake facilitator-like aquaporin
LTSCSVDHGLGVSALGNGFAYTSLVFAIAAISGGHMNPGTYSIACLKVALHQCFPLRCYCFSKYLAAISAAMVVTNRMTKPVFVSYVISQVLGAIFGALFLHWCLPKAAHAFVTSGAPHTK